MATDRDDLDDLFGDDDEDPFRPLSPPRSKAPVKESSGFTNSRNNRSAAGLGIDEEVEIAKKPRVPRVKLDEARLLSDAGIKKLRKTAKDKLKFKGKGHEFSDCARLLSFYQLWLDGLFPKANFADALAMVEKLGHKKTIQRMRMEWINEGKPRDSVHEDSIFDDPVPEPRERQKSQTAARIAPIFENNQSSRTKTPELVEEDIYGASPLPKRKSIAPVKSLFGGGDDDIPEDDDLDALFGEDDGPEIASGKTVAPAADPFENDDLDALFVEENTVTKAPSDPKIATTRNDFDDDEEAMMDMDIPW